MPTIVDLQPQPRAAHLNEEGQQAIQDLLQSRRTIKPLKDRLDLAARLLAEVAGEINERNEDHKDRRERKRVKLQAKGEEEDRDEVAEFERFADKVDELSQKMDHSVRGVVDDQIWLEDLPDIIRNVGVKTGAMPPPTQAGSIAPTQENTQANRDGRTRGGDGDEDMAMEDSPVAANVVPDPDKAPLHLLRSGFEEQDAKWRNKSLTEKYSTNNQYVEFYRMVFYAKHPTEETPLLPHANTWFANEEHGISTAGNTNQTTPTIRASRTNQSRSLRAARSRNQPTDRDEGDLEIAGEKIRLTCPITLLPFKDPYSSTKCPHSFEKSAIFGLLKRSNDHVPFSQDQRAELSQMSRQQRTQRERETRVPRVQCPECSVRLTADDLRPDPVLLRKVARHLETQKRDQQGLATSDVEGEEGEDDENDIVDGNRRGNVMVRGTQRRPLGLGSSPASSPMKPKSEQMKMEAITSSIPERPAGESGEGDEGVVFIDLGED